MNRHAVVIAGGGPTGMMLAAELALAKVDVAIVERRESVELDGSRAGGLHARTLELLDQRGVAERFISAGQKGPVARFAGSVLDLGELPTRHNYVLSLWQKDFERILAAWLDELPVRWYRGREVTSFHPDERGVDVTLSDGSTLQTAYLVGCDGGRSLVRKHAGIEFRGADATMSCLLAEAEMAQAPELGMRRDAPGTHGISKLGEGNTLRVMVTEREVGSGRAPTLDELRDALRAVYGTDYGVHSPSWLTRFTDAARQAVEYRRGRVLVAGDAAHVHFPVGGQGLNLGVQDAVNLGWKLAQVVKGTSPEALLDTYQAERHPVGAHVLRDTMAGSALLRPDERSKAVADLVGELLEMDGPRRHWAAKISGLAVRYALESGGEHRLVGRRMPDLELLTEQGPQRVFALLHDARGVLLHLDASASRQADARVRVVDARFTDALVLPELGEVRAPTSVLIRPDGYVAWVGERASTGLAEALTRWFGPAVG